MRNPVLTLSLLLPALPNVLNAAEITTQKLDVAYSLDQQICNEVAIMLKHDKTCRPYDASIDRLNPKMCAPEDVEYINLYGAPALAFQEIATNEYGYTGVFSSPSGDINGYTIIYLNQFNGLNNPRTVETWRVDTKALIEVLELSPGPLPYKSKREAYQSKDTRATEFAEVLSHGEKLTTDWSPIIKIKESYYLAERECDGMWEYGADYACYGIIKLNIKKLSPDNKIIQYCQFTKIIPRPSNEPPADTLPQVRLVTALSDADEQLNQAYQLQLRNASDADRLALRDAQRQWLARRNRECKFTEKGLSGRTDWLNAAVSDPKRANCLIQHTISRATELFLQQTVQPQK